MSFAGGSRRGLALALMGAALACPAAAEVHAQEAPRVLPEETRPVTKITGPGPLNLTDQRWNVYGTDLGSMFELDGLIYMTFGDTFGRPQTGDMERLAGERNVTEPLQYTDFRSNTMAYFSADGTDPDDVGPLFEGMITDPANPLRAKELLSSKKQICDGVAGPCEQTVIPTYGFAVGDRMYLHYMSVKQFNPPDEPMTYRLNHAGIAFSDDRGQTWTKSTGVTWGARSNFGQVAAVAHGAHVYLFGIPGGRGGSVKLARVASDKVLKPGAYRYWDGRAWTDREDAAAVVVPGRVGEFSVRWNSYFGKWLMMYTNEFDPNPGFHLRSADCLTGAWSDNQLVSNQYPSMYAPYMPPRWNDGPEVFFTMTVFFNYNVYWMRTLLEGPPRPGRTPCVSP